MGFLRSMVAAFACFSTLPMPRMEWEDGNMRYLMVAFPLVGVVAGALVFGWCLLADAIGMGPLLRAAGIVLVPIAVSGGIHLDGFADVLDAQASHASPERKRQVLKDPHIGAFAAIGLGAYLLLYAGLAGEVPPGWRAALLLGLVQVAVRCESGLATLLYAGSGEGMLSTFRESAATHPALAIIMAELAATAVAMLVLSPLPALVMLACGIACLLALKPFALRNFGGMSGDVAGFFLQACELAMVACLVACAKAVGL